MFRLTASGLMQRPNLPREAEGSAEAGAAKIGRRPIFVEAKGTLAEADIYDFTGAQIYRVAANEGLAAQIAQLADRVAATDTSARQSAEQVAAIEQRLSSISTELANQMSELGTDLHEPAAEPSSGAPAGASSSGGAVSWPRRWATGNGCARSCAVRTQRLQEVSMVSSARRAWLPGRCRWTGCGRSSPRARAR